jgi:hypothetical protein
MDCYGPNARMAKFDICKPVKRTFVIFALPLIKIIAESLIDPSKVRPTKQLEKIVALSAIDIFKRAEFVLLPYLIVTYSMEIFLTVIIKLPSIMTFVRIRVMLSKSTSP